jgi:hypothetical protein
MFGTFLIDQGIELNMRVEMDDVLRVLDQEVATFSHGGFGYQLEAGKVVLGAQWQLLVRPVNLQPGKVEETAIGYIVISLTDDGVSLQIPPRYEWHTLDAQKFDADGSYFTAFLLKLMSALQRRQLLELPWPLPVA